MHQIITTALDLAGFLLIVAGIASPLPMVNLPCPLRGSRCSPFHG